MTDPFFDRLATVLSEESTQPEQYLYLSFAGDTFHGGVVVKARGIAHAVSIANQLKINPGGEVFCVEIPEDKIPDPRFLNCLLTKPEIEQMWGEPCKSIREWEEEEEAAS